ncbi:MAG TPA: hypothetical protein VGN07_07095 [Steroidobacteraceae bacterium]|jgi:hypothetical protein
MLRHSRIATALWILAIALLAVRMGGEHLHLCLDGGEAAAAVHVFDVSEHSDSLDSGAHNDRNLDLSGTALLKKVDAGGALIPLLGLLVFLFLLPRVKIFLSRPQASAVPLAPVAYFIPPLRGPPL